MKKLLASFVVLSLLLSGCTGSFNLTKKVYNIHRSQSDKWVDEIIFLGLAICQIYSISIFADAVIFNSVEFWTGNNPVAGTKPQPLPIARNGVGTAVLSQEDAQPLPILQLAGQGWQERFVFTPEDGVLVARDASGTVRFRAVHNSDGSLTITDAQAQPLRTFSVEQILALAGPR